MAVVNSEFGKNLKRSVEYVTEARGPDDVFHAEGCTKETAVDNFRSVQKLHHKENGNPAFLMMQSFSQEESAERKPSELHAIGRKLVEEMFPGHQYVIRTHTDQAHTHNHIVVNPVHMETGKRIQNKYFVPGTSERLYDKIRATSDRICQEHGLSIIPTRGESPDLKVPYTAQKMDRFGKKPWLMDLAQKCDAARGISTSYDEYSFYLKEKWNIEARVEDRNITYFYPGKEKGKRGKTLGRKYDKPGLESIFKHNDQLLSNRPEMRNLLHAEFSALPSGSDSSLPRRDSGSVLLDGTRPTGDGAKDYSKFTRAPRPGRADRYQSDRELDQAVVPLSEIQRGKRSVIEYCHKNRIALDRNEKGQTTLKGRPYVVLSDFEVKNTRNGHVGCLIDFVAIHKDMTYLQALAHINQNPKLLVLEQYLGERKRTYNPYYIPKQNQAKDSERQLSVFLAHLGASPKTSRALLDSGRAQVSSHGMIRLFSEGDGAGALEFVQTLGNAWREKKQGRSGKPFFQSAPKRGQVHLFMDAPSYLRHAGEHAFSNGKKPLGILALLFPDEGAVDHFLAAHPQTHQITLVTQGREAKHTELDFFNTLKRRFHDHGIQFSIESRESLSRSRGPELSL